MRTRLTKQRIRSWLGTIRRKASDTRGAVTIFMIVVLAGVFMFTAVFIDYSRIAAMEVQSEHLTHAVVRSVMSAYEPEFQKDYGLFAFGESDATQLLDTALTENFNYTDQKDSFHLIPLQADQTSIQLSRPLGKYDTFNQQIQEEMKYKAPIDFTIEIVEKMRTMSGIMKETTQTVSVLNKVRKPYEAREKAIDKLIALQKKTADEVKELAKMIMYPAGSSIADKSVGSISSIAQIAAQFKNYTDLISEDKKRKKKDKPRINTAKIAAYKSRSSSLLQKIPSKLEKLLETHTHTYDEGIKLMSDIRGYNQQIADIIQQEKNRSANASYDKVSGAKIPGSTAKGDAGAEKQLAELRKNLDQLVLSQDLLNRMESSVKSQQDDYTTISQSVKSLMTEANRQITLTSGNASSLKSSTIRTARLLQTYLDNYSGSTPDGTIGKIEKELAAARAGTDSISKDEAKAEKDMKKAELMLGGIAGMGAAADVVAQDFSEVNGYYEDSLNFNSSVGGEQSKVKLDKDPYDESQKSMDAMDIIFGGVSESLMNGRNEFFQNEYAIHYFEPFDITFFRNMAESFQNGDGNQAADALAEVDVSKLVQEFAVEHQQVEYIIYGFDDVTANLTAAYSEIFGVRLAIRTAEGLVKSAKLGHPLAVLAAGVAYGVEMAIKDMIDLFTKGHTDLSAYMKVPFEYRDYLRLFLLQTNNEKKMSRMLALIRFGTKINPAERNTYASAHVRTGMRIWFLPGVMKMLKTGQADSSVEQGVYYADKQADYGY
ncbi:TadE/TadG family type IV pilus assembly protein [Paenibacillus dauci]|uniref:TadE/TadG family type IV pilus assembly protein n=1 Tax=Paenibacillus dauci TaxID=1567106 RepID=UPI000698F417|nr:hypothetical protein [Paenibacillus dauci]